MSEGALERTLWYTKSARIHAVGAIYFGDQCKRRTLIIIFSWDADFISMSSLMRATPRQIDVKMK